MNKIIKKPWGSEEFLTNNKKYLFKKLYMKKIKDVVCSFIKKIETIYVLSGLLEIQINNKIHLLKKEFNNNKK